MIKLPETKLYGESLEKYLNEEIWGKFRVERNRLEGFRLWTRACQDAPRLAVQHFNTERDILLKLSRTPWMGLMVNTFSQQLIVDGYRKIGSTDNAEAWKTWRRNNMGRQQFALNRDLLTFGYTFVKVTDSIDPITGKQMAAIRVKSPQLVFALWEDNYEDEWPQYVLERQANGQYWWWSDEDYVVLELIDGIKFKAIEVHEHDYGLVPFIRYVNDQDTDGRCWGDVEPVIEVAKRVDKTKFDVLLTQHFTGFVIRWATGLQQPDGMAEEDLEKEKIRLAQESIMISSNKDAKFGTLPAGPLGDLLEAYRESLKEFLALCQLPPNIAGQIINVAADALAAGTRSTVQKLWQKQAMFQVGHNQVMRLVNMIEGRMDEADSIDFTVSWQDVEIKSLAQFADAWGKMVQQLKIPAWGVWPMIPGVDQSRVDGWMENMQSDDGFISYIRKLQEAEILKPAVGGPNSAQNTPGANNRNGDPGSLSKQQPGAKSGV